MCLASASCKDRAKCKKGLLHAYLQTCPDLTQKEVVVPSQQERPSDEDIIVELVAKDVHEKLPEECAFLQSSTLFSRFMGQFG
eukprot:4944037-Amphidinium_carterae.1